MENSLRMLSTKPKTGWCKGESYDFPLFVIECIIEFEYWEILYKQKNIL